MSQWGRGEEAHAAMVLAIHLLNGGRTDILEGTVSQVISLRVVAFVKDILAVHGLVEGSAEILSVSVLKAHQGVHIYESKFVSYFLCLMIMLLVFC